MIVKSINIMDMNRMIDEIRKMDHISMSALKGPDGMIKVPDLFPKFHPIHEAEFPPSDGIEEPRLSLAAQAPIPWDLAIDEFGPALITIENRFFPEPCIVSMPGDKLSHVLGVDVIGAEV